MSVNFCTISPTSKPQANLTVLPPPDSCGEQNHGPRSCIEHLTNYGQKANLWTFSIFSHGGNYLGREPRSHSFD
jgi:hypothetical protein